MNLRSSSRWKLLPCTDGTEHHRHVSLLAQLIPTNDAGLRPFRRRRIFSFVGACDGPFGGDDACVLWKSRDPQSFRRNSSSESPAMAFRRWKSAFRKLRDALILRYCCISSSSSCEGSRRAWFKFRDPNSSTWHTLTTCREMDGEEGATAWAGGGESRQSSVTFGYARVKGLRDHPIEDYHVARMQSFDGSEIGLFAVYDGHAGTEVASYLEQELFNKILAHPNFRSDPRKTITEIYFSTDKRILDKAENETDFRAGSTATTAFLLDNNRRLVVANVGDSRAVLSRNGKAIEVSVDHEPQKPEEREMVESKGGEVALSPMGGVYRVDKRLNMSRAFGDFIIKEHLSVEPDIWDNSLTDEDDFFIVASDGLWKVMNNDEAVELVLAQTSAQDAAKVLAAAALRRGSRDDISVLVVCLKDLSSLNGQIGHQS